MSMRDNKRSSILSDRPDGYGYFYGFRDDDHRQINVRREPPLQHGLEWNVYVGGEKIGVASGKDCAEQMALRWMDEHPVT